jgi:hypothetical protein
MNRFFYLLPVAMVALAGCYSSNPVGPATSYSPGTYGAPTPSGTAATAPSGPDIGAGNNGIQTNPSNPPQ